MKTFSSKSTSIPKARWATYATAATASTLAYASSAEAEIHYSGLVNHNFAQGLFAGPLDPGVTLDLNAATGTQIGNYTWLFGGIHIRTPSQSTIGAFVGTQASFASFYLLELPARASLPLQHIGKQL